VFIVSVVVEVDVEPVVAEVEGGAAVDVGGGLACRDEWPQPAASTPTRIRKRSLRTLNSSAHGQ